MIFLKNVSVSNFKSFKDIDVALGDFNVLIGANASGKSNFVQIFKFIRDIRMHGLDNAISMQGGTEYLRNIGVGSAENLSLSFTSGNVAMMRLPTGSTDHGDYVGLRGTEFTYHFAIQFNKTSPGFSVNDDELIITFDIVQMEKHRRDFQEAGVLGAGQIRVYQVKRQLNLEIQLPDEIQIDDEYIFPKFLLKDKLPKKEIILSTYLPFILPMIGRYNDAITTYDFDPKLPKKAVSVSGRIDLEEDGSNLAIVLNHILSNPDRKRKMANLLTSLLPFVKGLGIERTADKSMFFKIKEEYYKRQIPSSLLSDGTINITALILALFFSEKGLTIIEEPERNIHPHLISDVINLMKDASRNTQIFATTHNPEVIKHVGINDILLIERDQEGYSRISRPGMAKEIKSFLENDIGVEELFIQNLLSGDYGVE